ncbi:MAG: prepilin-type N-terminal cleavage/methylation domain-containing protein [Phycisphaerales bacterium]
MSTSTHIVRRRAARGFTLVELIVAILVLGVGLVALAAIFPAGITQQQFANDDTYGRVVAEHALSVIRSKVAQEDFGSFDQFWQYDKRATGSGGAAQDVYSVSGGGSSYGVPGDWSWKRPGFVFDNPNTPADEGKIDIFSWEGTRLQTGAQPDLPLAAGAAVNAVDSSLARATEFPGGILPTEIVPTDPPAWSALYGIPYNRDKFDSDRNVNTIETEVYSYAANGAPLRKTREPAFFINQAERTWPQGAVTGAAPAQYVWECMFRRFQGRVLVAIFVFRVVPPGGEPRPYSTAQAASNAVGQPQGNPALPPLPVTIKPATPWNTTLPTSDVPPGTAANSAYNPGRESDAWQLPGQWILDKYNNVHRVLNGRRTQAEGPVKLARPVPTVPSLPALVGQPSGTSQPLNTIDQIWYIPSRDAAGNTLIPVFCTVEEL